VSIAAVSSYLARKFRGQVCSRPAVQRSCSAAGAQIMARQATTASRVRFEYYPAGTSLSSVERLVKMQLQLMASSWTRCGRTVRCCGAEREGVHRARRDCSCHDVHLRRRSKANRDDCAPTLIQFGPLSRSTKVRRRLTEHQQEHLDKLSPNTRENARSKKYTGSTARTSRSANVLVFE